MFLYRDDSIPFNIVRSVGKYVAIITQNYKSQIEGYWLAVAFWVATFTFMPLFTFVLENKLKMRLCQAPIYLQVLFEFYIFMFYLTEIGHGPCHTDISFLTIFFSIWYSVVYLVFSCIFFLFSQKHG